MEVDIVGNYAYVASWQSLDVIDVSDPYEPFRVGSCSTPGDAKGVAVIGSYAYVADAYRDMQIVDVSRPTRPTCIKRVEQDGYQQNIRRHGNLLFLCSGSAGVHIYYVPSYSRTSPILYDTYGTSRWAYDVAISDNRAYLALGADGVHILDITRPNDVKRIGTFTNNADVYETAVTGEHLFVANTHKGVQVIDVSNPPTPLWQSSIEPSRPGRPMAASQGRLFVVDNEQALRVFNISSPDTPVETGTYPIDTFIRDIAINQDCAYALSSQNDIEVVDFSDISNPIVLDQYVPENQGMFLKISEGCLYLICEGGIVEMMTLGPGGTIQTTATYDIGGHITAFDTFQGLVLAAIERVGIRVYDLSAPSPLTPLSEYPATLPIKYLVVDNSVAYFAYGGGIGLLDLTDPTSLPLLGSQSIPNGTSKILIDATLTYALKSGKLTIVDSSNPRMPQAIETLDMPGGPEQALNIGPYICFADYESGWTLFRLGLPGDFQPDGNVDLADLAIMTANWHASDCAPPEGCQGADIDNNATVNLSDLLGLSEYWLATVFTEP